MVVVVARYAPRGNFMGRFAENVHRQNYGGNELNFFRMYKCSSIYNLVKYSPAFNLIKDFLLEFKEFAKVYERKRIFQCVQQC